MSFFVAFYIASSHDCLTEQNIVVLQGSVSTCVGCDGKFCTCLSAIYFWLRQ